MGAANMMLTAPFLYPYELGFYLTLASSAAICCCSS
jgi:hypothetical protein